MTELGVEPMIGPSTSEVSAFIDKQVPALTLGITQVERLNQVDEELEIAPMYTGVAQVVALLLAIDRW